MPHDTPPTVEHHHGAYLLTYPDGKTELVQTDWDYPATAGTLGWRGLHRKSSSWKRLPKGREEVDALIRKIGHRRFIVRGKRYTALSADKCPYYQCEHAGTDGTVKCPDCGKPASAFIQEAAEFIDSLC